MAFDARRLGTRFGLPLVVIQGRDDEYGTTKQVDAIANAVTGPVSTLVLDGCGHAPHVDRQEMVLHAGIEFLRESLMSHEE